MAEKETKPEETKEQVVAYTGEPFILLSSHVEHNVARVLDKKKGISLFKFGRKNGGFIIPTRVPKAYGELLNSSHPGKYEVIPVPDKHKNNLDAYFKKLIEDQDAVDKKIEEDNLKAEIEKKRKELAALEKEGKVKKVVRE